MPSLDSNFAGANTELQKQINRLLGQRTEVESERRAHDRTPLVCAAMLKFDDDYAWIPIYIRDVSDGGIGFIHGVELPVGEATTSFKLENDAPVRLRVQVLWCKEFSAGWYISGGKFIDVDHTAESPWPS